MNTRTGTQVPAVDGWFTLGSEPRLIGQRCTQCETVAFPPTRFACPNPDCRGTELVASELSPRGSIWSFAVNHYPPPEPFVAPDPFEPYAVAAVRLDEEDMVILGLVAGDLDGLEVGATAELVVDTLFVDEEGEHVVWKWRIAGREEEARHG